MGILSATAMAMAMACGVEDEGDVDEGDAVVEGRVVGVEKELEAKAERKRNL